jgi:hypothetical protein
LFGRESIRASGKLSPDSACPDCAIARPLSSPGAAVQANAVDNQIRALRHMCHVVSIALADSGSEPEEPGTKERRKGSSISIVSVMGIVSNSHGFLLNRAGLAANRVLRQLGAGKNTSRLAERRSVDTMNAQSLINAALSPT